MVTTDPTHNRVRVAHKKVDRTYQYDHVFGPFASQEEVFTNTVEPIVREMLQVTDVNAIIRGSSQYLVLILYKIL